MAAKITEAIINNVAMNDRKLLPYSSPIIENIITYIKDIASKNWITHSLMPGISIEILTLAVTINDIINTDIICDSTTYLLYLIQL